MRLAHSANTTSSRVATWTMRKFRWNSFGYSWPHTTFDQRNLGDPKVKTRQMLLDMMHCLFVCDMIWYIYTNLLYFCLSFIIWFGKELGFCKSYVYHLSLVTSVFWYYLSLCGPRIVKDFHHVETTGHWRFWSEIISFSKGQVQFGRWLMSDITITYVIYLAQLELC